MDVKSYIVRSYMYKIARQGLKNEQEGTYDNPVLHGKNLALWTSRLFCVHRALQVDDYGESYTCLACGMEVSIANEY